MVPRKKKAALFGAVFKGLKKMADGAAKSYEKPRAGKKSNASGNTTKQPPCGGC